MKTMPIVSLALLMACGLKDDIFIDPDADADTDADADADADADTDTDTDTDTEPRPDWCPTTDQGWFHVEGTPASPYFVHNPPPDEWDRADRVYFLPGGSGDRGSTEGNFMGFFGRNNLRMQYQFVAIYSPSGNQSNDWNRIYAIEREVALCYGEKTQHLFGHSRGGYIAFANIMLGDDPIEFATVTGAPAVISQTDPTGFAAAFEGVSVHYTVGALDSPSSYEAAHEWMLDAGVDSTFWVWPGEGHVPGTSFDSTPFFTFWAAH